MKKAVPTLEIEAFSANEVCAKLGISRTTFWQLRKDNRIKVRRIGTKVLVLRADIDAFLKSLPAEAA